MFVIHFDLASSNLLIWHAKQCVINVIQIDIECLSVCVFVLYVLSKMSLIFFSIGVFVFVFIKLFFLVVAAVFMYDMVSC